MVEALLQLAVGVVSGSQWNWRVYKSFYRLYFCMRSLYFDGHHVTLKIAGMQQRHRCYAHNCWPAWNGRFEDRIKSSVPCMPAIMSVTSVPLLHASNFERNMVSIKIKGPHAEIHSIEAFVHPPTVPLARNFTLTLRSMKDTVDPLWFSEWSSRLCFLIHPFIPKA